MTVEYTLVFIVVRNTSVLLLYYVRQGGLFYPACVCLSVCLLATLRNNY